MCRPTFIVLGAMFLIVLLMPTPLPAFVGGGSHVATAVQMSYWQQADDPNPGDTTYYIEVTGSSASLAAKDFHVEFTAGALTGAQLSDPDGPPEGGDSNPWTTSIDSTGSRQSYNFYNGGSSASEDVLQDGETMTFKITVPSGTSFKRSGATAKCSSDGDEDPTTGGIADTSQKVTAPVSP